MRIENFLLGSFLITAFFFLPTAELLGLPLIPPYSQATGDQVRFGVNYASAAAGILDATGGNFVSAPKKGDGISPF